MATFDNLIKAIDSYWDWSRQQLIDHVNNGGDPLKFKLPFGETPASLHHALQIAKAAMTLPLTELKGKWIVKTLGEADIATHDLLPIPDDTMRLLTHYFQDTISIRDHLIEAAIAFDLPFKPDWESTDEEEK